MEVVQQIGARFKVEPSEIKKVGPFFSLLSFLLAFFLPPTYLRLRTSELADPLSLPPSLSPPSSRPLAPLTQSISSLIDREYMRRKDGELNVFEYVA